MPNNQAIAGPNGVFVAHGGRSDAARRRFPDAPLPWLDLSTGINPVAWPIERLAAPDHGPLPLRAALDDLCAAAGDFFGAGRRAITALPGSEIGLRLLRHLDPPRPWRVVVPTYRTHLDALPGAEPIAVARLAAEARRGGTILIANPNNPDGRVLPPAMLRDLAHMLATRGGMLVVDEAFADVADDIGLSPLLTAEDRVIVLRSFGKFFGLAGVRLGFMGGAAGPVAAMAAMLGDWPVSAQAIACGTAAYRDAGWIAATRRRLVADAATLDRLLADAGLAGQGNCPLFRLVECDDAAALFERLGQAGILSRPFDDRPDRLRLGLPGDAAGFGRLAAVLRHR
jgi:cobalamin biosynthetic protein CobC